VRRVFITGASTGIGAALARHYAGADSAIGLFARRRDLLEKLAANLPGRTAIYPADVTDTPAVAAAAQDFLARYGAPDLVIEQGDGIHITGSIGLAEAWERPSKWRAENHRTGLFLAAGPDIMPGCLAAPVRIIDIAPTILHVFGLDASEGMDGRPRLDLFARGGPPDRPVAAGLTAAPAPQSAEDEALVEERLRNLGYL